jgi:hypothetical protein
MAKKGKQWPKKNRRAEVNLWMTHLKRLTSCRTRFIESINILPVALAKLNGDLRAARGVFDQLMNAVGLRTCRVSMRKILPHGIG